MTKCIKKGILPIVGFVMLLVFFKRFYIVNGELDLFRLWMLIGLPFGITKMMIWLLPKGLDIGCSIGMFVFSIIVSGLFGGFIALFTMIESAAYLIIMPLSLLSGRRRTI